MKSFKTSTYLLVILLVTLLVYVNTLPNGFVWDDEEQIVNNVVIQSFSNIGVVFHSGTFNTGGAGLSGWFYRPMVSLTYLLLFQLFGLRAWGYHLLMVGLHLANVIMVFGIMRRLLAKEWALVGALAFGVHAGAAETVAYIASLGDLLVASFGLLAVNLVMRLNQFELKSKKSLPTRMWWILAIVTVAMFLAFLSKESAVVWLPVVILAGWVVGLKKEMLVKVGISALVATGMYAFIRLVVVGMKINQPDMAPIAEASLMERLTTMPSIISHYLRLLVWPDKLSVSQHWVVKSVKEIQFWGSLGVIIVILALLVIWWWKRFRQKRDYRRLAFWSLWVVVGLGLVSQIIPLDMTVAERWLYFPLVGLIGLIMMALQEVGERNRQWKPMLVVACLLVLVPLAIRTMVRNRNWHDGFSLYSHDINITQNSFDLENNYGVELFRAGKYEQAKKHFEASIRLQPKWKFAHNNLGAVYQQLGELDKAKKKYLDTLAISDYYLAWENLALLKLKLDPDKETEVFLHQGINKLPGNDTLMMALAIVKQRLDKPEEALSYALRAYQLKPSSRNAYVLQAIRAGEEIKLE